MTDTNKENLNLEIEENGQQLTLPLEEAIPPDELDASTEETDEMEMSELEEDPLDDLDEDDSDEEEAV